MQLKNHILNLFVHKNVLCLFWFSAHPFFFAGDPLSYGRVVPIPPIVPFGKLFMGAGSRDILRLEYLPSLPHSTPPPLLYSEPRYLRHGKPVHAIARVDVALDAPGDVCPVHSLIVVPLDNQTLVQPQPVQGLLSARHTPTVYSPALVPVQVRPEQVYPILLTESSVYCFCVNFIIHDGVIRRLIIVSTIPYHVSAETAYPCQGAGCC